MHLMQRPGRQGGTACARSRPSETGKRQGCTRTRDFNTSTWPGGRLISDSVAAQSMSTSANSFGNAGIEILSATSQRKSFPRGPESGAIPNPDPRPPRLLFGHSANWAQSMWRPALSPVVDLERQEGAVSAPAASAMRCSTSISPAPLPCTWRVWRSRICSICSSTSSGVAGRSDANHPSLRPTT